MTTIDYAFAAGAVVLVLAGITASHNARKGDPAAKKQAAATIVVAAGLVLVWGLTSVMGG